MSSADRASNGGSIPAGVATRIITTTDPMMSAVVAVPVIDTEIKTSTRRIVFYPRAADRMRDALGERLLVRTFDVYDDHKRLSLRNRYVLSDG